jgi:mannosyltransferase
VRPFGQRKAIFRIALLAVCLLGLALRLIGLEQEDYWHDELFSYYTAKQSFGPMWQTIINDVHPPLFYLVFHYWLNLLDRLLSLRLFAVLWGVLTIPVVYLVGKKAIRSDVGLLAALLLAVSPFHVKFSQELRMYTMYPFFLALAMLATICALRYKKWRFWVMLAVTNALMFYTHYHTAFHILGQAVFVAAYLVKKTRVRIRWQAGASYALTAALIVLWAPVILHQWQVKQVAYTWVPEPTLSDLFYTIFVAYFYGLEVVYVHKLFMWGFAIGVLGFLVVNAVRRSTRERRDFWSLLFVATLVIPIATTFLLSYTQYHLFYLWRYIMLSLIPFLLLMAHLLAKVRPHLLRVVLIAAVVTTGIFCSLKSSVQILKPRWKTLVQEFERVATREDHVYAYPYELLSICYDYYSEKSIPLEDFSEWLKSEMESPESFYLILDPKQEREGLNPFLLHVLRHYATVETVYEDPCYVLLLRISNIDSEAIRQWYSSRERVGHEELPESELVKLYDAGWTALDRNPGFSFKEVSSNFAYVRWTASEEATFQISPELGKGFYWILLKLAQSYPPEIEDWEYTVRLDGQTRAVVKENYNGYTGFYLFGSPRLHALQIQIHSPVFVPAEMGVNDDTRTLGLQFHWLAILRVNPEMVPSDQHFRILDIGSPDEGAERLIGWHAKEHGEDYDFRWTGDTAQVEFSLTPELTEKLHTLKIRALQGGPQEIAPALASVYLNDRILGQRRIDKRFRVYEFPLIQGDLRTSNTLTIESSTWNPKERGVSSDNRDLGVLVDWITLD